MGAGLCACGIELQVGPGNDSADGGTSSSGGGSGDDDATDPGDGRPVVQLCDPTWQLSVPEAVPGVATGESTGQPRLTADETTVYFNRVIAGTWRVLTASRPDATSAFGEAALVTSIETVGFEHYWPSISADGLTLSFSRFNEGAQEILDAHRASRADDFGAPQLLASGSLLLFRVPGSNEYFYSRYDGAGHQSIADAHPDGDTLLFDGHPGQDLPLWYETAAQTLWFTRDQMQLTSFRGENGFEEPRDPATLGAAMLVTWVSPDGCRLYGSDPEALGTLKMQRRESPQ